MSVASINGLQYVDWKDNTMISLLAEKCMLEASKGFAVYKELKMRKPLTPNDWLAVTEDEFDNYQGSLDGKKFGAGLYSAVMQTYVALAAPEARGFKYGVKCNQFFSCPEAHDAVTQT